MWFVVNVVVVVFVSVSHHCRQRWHVGVGTMFNTLLPDVSAIWRRFQFRSCIFLCFQSPVVFYLYFQYPFCFFGVWFDLHLVAMEIIVAVVFCAAWKRIFQVQLVDIGLLLAEHFRFLFWFCSVVFRAHGHCQ